ncbi:MAG: TetR family transcriptional regulator [Candidatus Parcubacteria bacterium]|nr:TetR family transcriptional regulator [Burkholderiales bacterium]
MTRSQLKRARAPEHKTERRAAILRAAEALLRRDPAATFAVGEIARRAGLAKGTMYLYFGSREELLLAVHDTQMDEMFGALERALARPKAGADAAARAVLGFLRHRPEFFRLSTSCHGALEDSVSASVARDHREAVASRLVALGRRIEILHPGMRPGEGATLLKNSYALMLGLWQLAASPLRVTASAPGQQEPEALRIDFESQLAVALKDLWNAAVRRGEGRLA